ncbi:RagB/SusD family nutrient uptake outer membrane protein [Flavobacterium sp.]|uniref:RagB/SusD family nutrient uptake outer membrane protein n=1 Tax=Flavobacterium sp. TaxID=239 RepID=UPI002616264D|nr:RagB/SusD family nutrient uptake outer membrane protein [Flavobacterium sp.]
MSSLLFFSCDNTLDLNPEDSLTPAVVFSNETLANGALNGMYSACQSSNVLSGSYDAATEWQTDNVKFVGSFPTFNDIYNYTTLSDNTSIAGFWAAHYVAILQANGLIKNVPNVPSQPTNAFTPAEKANIIGQAKFIRALMYFRLSANFGHQLQQNLKETNLSVPLVLEPFEGNIDYPKRSTLKEVHGQIEKDLLDAISSISVTSTDRTKGTVAGAKALLARLYLYQEKWAQAADFANQVINTPGFSLATNFTFYNTLSPELIFTLQNVAGDAAPSESYSNLFNGINANGRGDCPFSDNLKALFTSEAGDLRFSAALTRTGTNAVSVSDLFTTKYPNAATRTDDPPVIRISEMFLIRAEANLRGGLSVGGSTPAADVNRTRVRAGLTPLASVTLTQILDERRKEFCFEGLRRMDLLRNNLPLRSAGLAQSAESAPGADKTIYPIPQRERDINPNIEQNKGY